MILGKNVANYLAEQGAKIVVLDRAAEIGKELEAELNQKSEALFLVTDVLNKEVLEENKKAILERFGTIDVLLNAAGGNMPGATIAPDKTVLDLDVEAFRKVVDLNLFGTVLPTMVFVDVMAKNKKGAIVNFCSESALRPLTRVVGYGSAKAAIGNYTRYMATELATKFSPELRVNAIVPGFLLTNQNRALLTNPDGSFTLRETDIYSLLIPIHYRISVEQIKAMAEASNMDEFFAVLQKTPYARHYNFEQDLMLEQLYEDCLYHLYTADRRQNPYSIASINMYLFLKEEDC